MASFNAASLAIGLIGLALGVAVSARAALHRGDALAASSVVGGGSDGSYAFGLAVGSNLWSVTLSRTTPALLAA